MTIDLQANKEEFLSLCHKYIKRDGLDKLLAWLESTDFFTAPASTKYHLCVEGGLCQHSLNVFHRMVSLCNYYFDKHPQAAGEKSALSSVAEHQPASSPVAERAAVSGLVAEWDAESSPVAEPAQVDAVDAESAQVDAVDAELPTIVYNGDNIDVEGAFDMENIAIVGLFHDICKANCYVRDFKNVKKDGKWTQEEYWKWEEQFVYGHGTKSVYMLQQFMRLYIDEALAIRFHMGGKEDPLSEVYERQYSQVFEKSKFAVLLHLADQMSVWLDEAEV